MIAKYKCPYCGDIKKISCFWNGSITQCVECHKNYIIGDMRTAIPVEEPEPEKIRPAIGNNGKCHYVKRGEVIDSNVVLKTRDHDKSIAIATNMLTFEKYLFDCHSLLAKMRGEDPDKAKRMIEKAEFMYTLLKGVVQESVERDTTKDDVIATMDYIDNGKEDE